MPLNRSWPWSGLPREARDTLFLLAVIGLIVTLQAPQLPAWCTAMAIALLGWRGWLAQAQRPLPAAPWRLGVLALALGATWVSHRTWLGPEAGVTLIVVLLALKTLELRARRDAFVVFFLGFFTLLTQFFHSQSLATALGMGLAVLGLLTALVLAHMPVGQPPLWRAMRLAGGMALLGTPIMLLLFLGFPRLPPLWGLPADSTLGRSGLSGQIRVGDIARLALDDSIALRVAFLAGPRPAPDQLYFRGPVLSVFDGQTWRPSHQIGLLDSARPDLQLQGPAVRYQLTMQPSQRPWLLTLEATPAVPALGGEQPRQTPDGQWLLRRPLIDTTRFEAEAWPQHRHGPLSRTLELQADLELPPARNPRTLQWAQDLRRQLGAEADAPRVVAHVLETLRQGGYRYTLEPGLFGPDSADEFWFDRRQGFCEHIAASFVILMRALDIPARLVTGYQGGELNPVDGLWTVRQSDAHAWAEVWMAGQGWVRVDPTTQVQPARTQALERLLPAPGLVASALLQLNPGLLRQVQALWEAANSRWNHWILNYTQSRQFDLLRQLGVSQPDWTDLLVALGLALAGASAAGLAWALWARPRPDPWLRLWQRTLRRWQRAGWSLPAHATPGRLMQAMEPLPAPDRDAWREALRALERQRYDPQDRTPLSALARRLRALPVPPCPMPPPPRP